MILQVVVGGSGSEFGIYGGFAGGDGAAFELFVNYNPKSTISRKTISPKTLNP